MTTRILQGNCLALLPALALGSVQCCVTSPPYFGLRDYGVAGQIGAEATPEAYVAALVGVFRALWPVLRDDGTLWLNLGDSYAGGGNGGGGSFAIDGIRGARLSADKNQATRKGPRGAGGDIKPKDLMGIPWRVAFALQADGWYLRSAIVWAKPNPMPESVTDRPTSSYEHVFLLTKAARYFYDADAIREPASKTFVDEVNAGYQGSDTKDFGVGGAQSASGTKTRIIANARARIDKQRGHKRGHGGFNGRWDAMTKDEQQALGSNARNVWTIATAPYAEAHFATFPPELAERCIKAGSKPGDTILDPFAGAFTTAMVAGRLQRHAIGIELNPAYCAMAQARIERDAGMFADVAAACLPSSPPAIATTPIGTLS